MACSSLLSDDDLRRFRTKPCRRNHQTAGGRCEFGPDRCQYSHCESWPRRCPFYLSHSTSIRYIPRICPDVTWAEGQDPAFKTIGTVLSNKCSRGGACPFAHSLEELLYHPLHYKTKFCPSFLRGDCSTYYCPFIHGTAERRDVSAIKYSLPFSNGVFKTSPFPNVELTSGIPSSTKSQQSQSCLNNKITDCPIQSSQQPDNNTFQSPIHSLLSSHHYDAPLPTPSSCFDHPPASSAPLSPSLALHYSAAASTDLSSTSLSTQSLSAQSLLSPSSSFLYSQPLPNTWVSVGFPPSLDEDPLKTPPPSLQSNARRDSLRNISDCPVKSNATEVKPNQQQQQRPPTPTLFNRSLQQRSRSQTEGSASTESGMEINDLNQSIQALLLEALAAAAAANDQQPASQPLTSSANASCNHQLQQQQLCRTSELKGTSRKTPEAAISPKQRNAWRGAQPQFPSHHSSHSQHSFPPHHSQPSFSSHYSQPSFLSHHAPPVALQPSTERKKEDSPKAQHGTPCSLTSRSPSNGRNLGPRKDLGQGTALDADNMGKRLLHNCSSSQSLSSLPSSLLSWIKNYGDDIHSGESVGAKETPKQQKLLFLVQRKNSEEIGFGTRLSDDTPLNGKSKQDEVAADRKVQDDAATTLTGNARKKTTRRAELENEVKQQLGQLLQSIENINANDMNKSDENCSNNVEHNDKNEFITINQNEFMSVISIIID